VTLPLSVSAYTVFLSFVQYHHLSQTRAGDHFVLYKLHPSLNGPAIRINAVQIVALCSHSFPNYETMWDEIRAVAREADPSHDIDNLPPQ
jgi:hypothetical protein